MDFIGSPQKLHDMNTLRKGGRFKPNVFSGMFHQPVF